MTQLAKAKRNEVTAEMEAVAGLEGVELSKLVAGVASGRIIIPANQSRRREKPLGIGEGLRVKVNANIGTSRDCADLDNELAKLQAALDAGADSVMDLSTGGDLERIRNELISRCPVIFGTVPIYQAAAAVVEAGNKVYDMKAGAIIDSVRAHARAGVDFVTVHTGVTRAVLDELESHPRVCGVVSRGGAFLAAWIMHNKQENPLYERFDELLDIAREFDLTLSLGDGLRPGAIADAGDAAQVHETLVISELAKRAYEADVQVMIEGPGHVPLHLIQSQMQAVKALCNRAPLYVLGPLVTDVAPGYDHITSAIGGAFAAYFGADFLCYVTPTEHLGLPSPEHVREGVMAARIAAHAADVAKGLTGAANWDLDFSRCRQARDWEGQFALALDPQKARTIRQRLAPQDQSVCSMCGEYCVFKVLPTRV